MIGFERGDVILNQAARAHYFNGVRPHNILVMIAQGDVEKYARQQYDYGDTRGRARENFEMKMPLTEKPGETSADEAPSFLLVVVRLLGVAHYNY